MLVDWSGCREQDGPFRRRGMIPTETQTSSGRRRCLLFIPEAAARDSLFHAARVPTTSVWTFRRNSVECAIVCIKTCSYVCIYLCKHSNMEKYKHASRCDPVLYLSLQPHEGCSITCIAQFIALCSWLKVVVWSKYANRLSPGCVIRNLHIFYILGRLIRSNSNR